jgi:FAD/FMN-containing dehydrogenase
MAAANGWRVGIRSGGHSWSCNHVREGGMLLDLSRLNQVEVDEEWGQMEPDEEEEEDEDPEPR